MNMGMLLPHRIGTWRAKWCHALVLLYFIVMAAPSLEAAEGKRVAFVVGIGKYDNLGADKQLKNAVNDAEGVSAKLTEAGVQVVKVSDVGRSDFYAKWYEVVNSLTQGDTFILFYSGHGVQIGGHNYLLPRDVPPIRYERRDQLKQESISLNELLADLSTGERQHPKYSVVILDACRDDPFVPPEYKSATTPTGLARVAVPNGFFVIYSAASNRTALDRLSPNDSIKYSVFTRTLLPLIGRRDLSIQELTTELKNQVWKLAKSAGRYQLPSYYDEILGRFCLPGCAMEADKTAPAQPGLPSEKTGKDGAPMVLIPAGSFLMGSTKEEVDQAVKYCIEEHGTDQPTCEGWYRPEIPQHEVELDAFYLDKYEVTNQLFRQFAQRAGYQTTAEREGNSHALVEGKGWEDVKGANWRKPEGVATVFESGRVAHPVVSVSWIDAQAYCSWAGKRLPTEAEFEYATRAGTETRYWWGNGNPGSRRVANIADESVKRQRPNASIMAGYDDGYVRTAPVGSFDSNMFGLHDMVGNVAEWVVDRFDPEYYGQRSERNPKGSSRGDYRVIRGGSWDNDPINTRSADRGRLSPTLRNVNIGFRCAQDIPRNQNQRTTSFVDREIRPRPIADSVKMITGKDGAPMVLIPAGEFMMGSREDMARDKDELPAHLVDLDAYYIDQYEVTISRYGMFFKETNREVPRDWPVATLDEHERKPVVGVDWNDATEYCSWAGKRLPTEAEWEKAARGTDRRLYPWGNETPDKTRANFSKVVLSFKYGVFADIGSYEAGKSPYGLYDMAGNAQEWVADWYDRDYYSKSPTRNPTGPSSGQGRVLRGGAWNFDSVGIRTGNRKRTTPTERNDKTGFRCAQDIPK